ncbi:MAG: formyltransferase family protein [Gammaproteobacteria bacterium]
MTNHPFRFAWFSSGQDTAARDLLRAAHAAIQNGTIPAELLYVFVNYELGESSEPDAFLQLCNELHLPCGTISSQNFQPDLRRRDRLRWREEFHHCITRFPEIQGADAIVFSGYMLIASKDFCETHAAINLHPALPGGPKGTWQQVIDALVTRRATISGVQIHRVTNQLDAGPALCFCTFTIPDEPDSIQLRTKIRALQTTREIPLQVAALRLLAFRDITFDREGFRTSTGQRLAPIDLTSDINSQIDKS